MVYTVGAICAAVLAVTARTVLKKTGNRPGDTLIIVVYALLGGVCGCRLYADRTDIINLCKMLVALWGVTVSACVDYREHRIPNRYPVILLLSAAALLTCGYLTGQSGAEAYLVSSLFSMVVCAICLATASFLTKGGIGAGDIKLFSSLGLLVGVYAVCGTAFFAILICAAVSVALLLLKKKTLHDAVAFGPFICLGYMITVLLSAY